MPGRAAARGAVSARREARGSRREGWARVCAGPQAAALVIFSVAAVLLLGLLAIHEAPFEPPVFVPPGPIIDVLRQVPP